VRNFNWLLFTPPLITFSDPSTSFAFSLPQRTYSLGLNGYLGCTGLIPGGLCCEEMMMVDLVFGGLGPAGA
jgi:hypothetical protein